MPCQLSDRSNYWRQLGLISAIVDIYSNRLEMEAESENWSCVEARCNQKSHLTKCLKHQLTSAKHNFFIFRVFQRKGICLKSVFYFSPLRNSCALLFIFEQLETLGTENQKNYA